MISKTIDVDVNPTSESVSDTAEQLLNKKPEELCYVAFTNTSDSGEKIQHLYKVTPPARDGSGMWEFHHLPTKDRQKEIKTGKPRHHKPDSTHFETELELKAMTFTTSADNDAGQLRAAQSDPAAGDNLLPETPESGGVNDEDTPPEIMNINVNNETLSEGQFFSLLALEMNCAGEWLKFIKSRSRNNPAQHPPVNKASLRNLSEDNKQRLLVFSVKEDIPALFSALLPDVNADQLAALEIEIDNQNHYILHIAVVFESPEIIKLMVSRGCKVNHTQNIKYLTPLMLAVKLKNRAVVIELLKADIDNIDKQTASIGNNVNNNNWWNPLTLAVVNNDTQMARLLYDKGASLTAYCGEPCNNPLTLAIIRNKYDMVFWLIEQLPPQEINRKNWKGEFKGLTCLDIAAKSQQLDIVEKLLERGASLSECQPDVLHRIGWGKTDFDVLKTAAAKGNSAIASAIIRREVSLTPGSSVVELDLHKAASQLRCDIAGELIPDDCDKDSLTFKNADGDTPLHAAIKKYNYFVVKKLAELGADINKIPDKNGYAPIFLAIKLGHRELVNVLLKSLPGFDINRQQDGQWWTPMALAADTNNIKMAEFLLSNGARLDAFCGKPNNTPLQLAISHGKNDMTYWLINKTPADKINDKNTDGERKGFTALDIAVVRKQLNVVDKLLEKGAVTGRSETRFTDELAGGTNHYLLLKTASLKSMTFLAQAILNRPVVAGNITPELQLHQLAALTDNDCALRFISEYLKIQGVLRDFQNADEDTALHVAIEKNNVPAVRVLTDNGCRVNHHLNRHGHTPLMTAIKHNNPEIVEILLSKGNVDNINAQSLSMDPKKPKCWWTPMAVAAIYDNPAIADLLLKAGAEPDAYCGLPDATPLKWAIEQGKPKMTLWLIEHTRDINHTNQQGSRKGFTALDNAAKKNQIDVIEKLLEHGAHIDACHTPVFKEIGWGSDDFTVLNRASKEKKPFIIRSLIKREVTDPRTCAVEELELFKLANRWLTKNYQAEFERFKKSGVNVNFKNNYKNTPLHNAIYCHNAIHNNTALVNALIEMGARVHEPSKNKNSDSRTPAELAIITKKTDMAVLLLNTLDKSDYERQPEHYWSLFALAVESNNTALTELMLDKGIDINIDCSEKDCSALMLAVKRNHAEMAVWLIKNGIDLSKQNQEGQTAIHMLIDKNNSTLLSKIVPHATNINVKNRQGKTPLDYAREKDNKKAARILTPYQNDDDFEVLS